MYSYHNFILFFILIFNLLIKCVLNQYIIEGVVSKINLSNLKDIHIFFNSNYSPILIHILSVDCEIKIVKDDEEQFVDINSINNFKYDAFSVITNESAIYLNINLLNNPSKQQNYFRNYSLIINQVYFGNLIPELNVKENEPVFLYFNNALKFIKLIYNFQNSEIEYPIIVSFFIKEKIKYKIEISEDDKNIINRIIDYKENIIIKPKYNAIYNILIIPEKEDIINSTMLVKIIHNNSIPFNLQRNQLNLGFIPKNINYYYYYMEVFEGEEGEILLFNKRQNGILISSIVISDDIPIVNYFPKYSEIDASNDDYLKFDIYNQKLSFNSYHTKKCKTSQCYLLMTYYSNISEYLDINGTEFSLLSRVWEKGESKSQIINIPLNEYIFGNFDGARINIDYYSLFIPYNTKNIYFEIHGMNILGYSQKGIVQINTKNMAINTKKLFDKCENNMIIKLDSEDINLYSFEGEYISISFEKNSTDIHSYYYFRILQQNSQNDFMVYPLDTNKENYCEAKDNKCYFLLKNEYYELSNKIVIYGFGKNDVSYKVFLKIII